MDYNFLNHLKKISALFSVYEVLMMSKELREVFIQALLNPKTYETFVVVWHLTEPTTMEADEVMFVDNDLMLGMKDHNRSIYIEGSINDVQLKMILIIPGSAVNLLSLRTLKKLGRLEEDLQSENITIQSFNKNREPSKGPSG